MLGARALRIDRATWVAFAGGIGLLVGLHSPANGDCARLSPCGESQVNALMRKTQYGVAWYLYELPNSPYIGFDHVRYAEMTQQVMDTYSGLGDYVPNDLAGGGTSDYYWGWLSQAQINAMPGLKRTGIPAAVTQNALDVPDRPCRIKATEVWFAHDPNDGVSQYCWAPPECFTPLCVYGLCDIDVFDYLGAAMHEYGHALGLGHSDDADATLYPEIFIQDIEARTLKDCEATFIAQKYRENFGPALLDSFTARPSAGSVVTCTWTAQVEHGCRSYRLSRVCPDGTSALVADSVQCLGPGVPYVALDLAPCPGEVKYVLSLVDSLAPGLWEEDVIAEAALLVGGTAPQAVQFAARPVQATSDVPGFGTPEEAVEALGRSVTGRDNEGARRTLADGFSYFTVDGLFWGRAIDGILEETMLACLAASNSTIDSLAFEPQQTSYLGENLAEVTAVARYVHSCQAASTDWHGQIVALVERRRLEGGWRIRQIVER